MKRASKWIALVFAGALGLILLIAIVVGLASPRTAVDSGTSTSTPTSTPTSSATPIVPTPSESAAPAPTPQPANPQTIVARRGINPLYQLIELSCDEPDSIDVDSWRIDGDNVIYRVSDYDTDWSSTATTSFAALEAGASPVFITDAADWQSNGCFPSEIAH
jgi:hypothetical protein